MGIIALVLIILAVGLNLVEVFYLNNKKIDTRINCCSIRLGMIAISFILQLATIIRALQNNVEVTLFACGATFIYMLASVMTFDSLVAVKTEKKL